MNKNVFAVVLGALVAVNCLASVQTMPKKKYISFGWEYKRLSAQDILDNADKFRNTGIDGIGIAPDSKWLRPLYGADFIELISTSHHQAIDPDALGRGLTIAASTSDGIVEAVEYRDNLFVLALQWHPERDALFNARSEEISQDSCNAPLRELVKFAVIHAARKN
jgi:gamma-glutamyl-gamma-aminobutyrate hydrolase PuuD